MTDLNLIEVSHLARSIVKEAGDKLRMEWKIRKEIITKDARDLATQYDTLVERQITQNLNQLFPGHSVYGEEETKVNHRSEYAWYIDPIDGTKYFADDIPLFTTALGLTKNDQPILGVVYNPVSGQMYSGFEGGKAHLNYEDIGVFPNRPLQSSIIYADISKYEHLSVNQHNWIKNKYFAVADKTYRMRSFGCGSLGLSWIATGAFDAFIDFTGKTKFFDVCAGLAILKAAGGVYKYIEVNDSKLLIAASNSLILNSLIELLSQD